MSDLKTSIEKLIVASKNLMNNYNDEYLTAGEEETLHEMKEAIKLVEKASEDANNKEQALDLHIVSNNEVAVCRCSNTGCDKHKHFGICQTNEYNCEFRQTDC